MAIDRQSIEKKDFPIARRGYEPEAVDQHLSSLSQEVDRLQRELSSRPADSGASPAPAARPPAASLAIAASEQVRAIVEAAETSAQQIEQAAEQESVRIHAQAEAGAQETRNDAVQRSEDHVGRVSEATSLMLQRVDAMEGELTSLIENLRTGANRLNADLALLQGNMGELYDASSSTAPSADPEPSYAYAPPAATQTPSVAMEAAEASAFGQPEQDDDEPGTGSDAAEQDIASHQDEAEPGGFGADPEPELSVASEPELFEAPVVEDEPSSTPPPQRLEVVPEPEPLPIEADAPASADAAGDDDGGDAARPARSEGGDVEGARLIALNMALNGQTRDETDRYLRDNFDLNDRDALLDEVYATVEG